MFDLQDGSLTKLAGDAPGCSQANPITVEIDGHVIPETIPMSAVDVEISSNDEAEVDDTVLPSPDSAAPDSSSEEDLSHSEPGSPEQSIYPVIEIEYSDKGRSLFDQLESFPPSSPELGGSVLATALKQVDTDTSAFTTGSSGRNIFQYILNNNTTTNAQEPEPLTITNVAEPEVKSLQFEETNWPDTDPFFETNDDLFESQVVHDGNSTWKAPASTKLAGLPPFSTKVVLDGVEILASLPEKVPAVKKSALSIKELIHEKDAISLSKKRKADDISTDEVGQSTSLDSTVKDLPAAGAEIEKASLQISGALPTGISARNEEIPATGPPLKRSRFNYLQFTGGVLLGAIGAIAGLVALPEDYFA